MLPAATEEPSQSSASSDGGELRVLMMLTKPEIILVEDATKLETDALMMTVSVCYLLLTQTFLRMLSLSTIGAVDIQSH